jgi:hypothetical protein
MAQRLVTVKGATVRVSPVGLQVTGADTAKASDRLAFLTGRNNGAHLRNDDDRKADRGAVLAGCHALIRTGQMVPSLAEARNAYRNGSLKCVTAPVTAITTGGTPASVNMALDRDAKAFGSGMMETLRAFIIDGQAIIYLGSPK